MTALAPLCDLTLLCYGATDVQDCRSLLPGINTRQVPPYPNSELSSLLSRFPNNTHRYNQNHFAQHAVRICRELAPDVIVVDSLAMAWTYKILIETAPQASLVYFSHNFESALRANIAAAEAGNLISKLVRSVDSFKTAILERNLCLSAHLITAITEHDLHCYASSYPTKARVLITPGYHNIPSQLRPLPKTRTACIIGSFLWSTKRANLVQFLDEGYRTLQQGNVTLKIIGNMEEPFRRHLRQKYPQLDITGKVGSLAEATNNCRAGLLIDSVGGGFKLKALDYIFLGLPMYALSDCMYGLNLTPQDDYIEASTSNVLADFLAHSISDDSLLGLRDRAYLKSRERFSWRASAAHFLDAIRPPLPRNGRHL